MSMDGRSMDEWSMNGVWMEYGVSIDGVRSEYGWSTE